GLAHHRPGDRVELRAKPFEREDGVGSDDAVGVASDVPLELADGAIATGPEDPVLPSGVEPERVQSPLQRADVVPAKERLAEVQRAISRAEPGLDQLRPGLGPDAAIPAESSLLLEAADRGAGRGAERAAELERVDRSAERDQTVLHVLDVGAAVTLPDRSHAESAGMAAARRRC